MRNKDVIEDEIKEINRKMSICHTRIRNTLNPKTEEKIKSEIAGLKVQKEKLDQELELCVQ